MDEEIADLLQELVAEYGKDHPTANPFPIDEWRKLLASHPKGKLYFGFIQKGWNLDIKPGVKPQRLSQRIRNFVRSRRECVEILKRILKELKKGYIKQGRGYYQLNLLCVPKKNGATGLYSEIRVARHGSYAKGDKMSINDAILDSAKKMILPGFMDYVRHVYPFRVASLRDLKDFFRQMLLAMEDREYIQYCIFGLYFQDQRMVYGTASAAARSQDFSILIIWVINKHCPEFRARPYRIIVHIDDFLIVALNHNESVLLRTAFDNMLERLHVIASVEKNENDVVWYVTHGSGIKMDCQTVMMPKRKALEVLRGVICSSFVPYMTAEAAEGLTGKIMHWAKLDKKIKAFCHCGISEIHKYLRRIPKHVKRTWIYKITPEWRQVMLLFLHFFARIREVTMQSLLFTPSFSVAASSDACDDGAGFMVANMFYAYKFSTKPNKEGVVHADMHINLKEAHAIIQLLHHFRKELTGKRIWLACDNQVCVHALARSWSQSYAMMEMVQEIVLLQLEYCIDLYIDWIPSWMNEFADMLSRFDMKGFHKLANLWSRNVIEQHNVDYYERLRILHGEIPLPRWLSTGQGLPNELNRAPLQ